MDEKGTSLDQKPSVRAPPSYDSVFVDPVYHQKDSSDGDISLSPLDFRPPPDYSPPNSLRRQGFLSSVSSGDPGPSTLAHLSSAAAADPETASSRSSSSRPVNPAPQENGEPGETPSLDPRLPPRTTAAALNQFPELTETELIELFSLHAEHSQHQQKGQASPQSSKKGGLLRRHRWRFFWLSLLVLISLAAIISVSAVLTQKPQLVGCQPKLIRTEVNKVT